MGAQSPQPVSMDHMAEIIRRDLMLGAEIELGPDTPLFGGDFDLDSLDALLLMQSLEREFGFKLPSEAFGPHVFENITTLTRFVEEHRRDADE